MAILPALVPFGLPLSPDCASTLSKVTLREMARPQITCRTLAGSELRYNVLALCKQSVIDLVKAAQTIAACCRTVFTAGEHGTLVVATSSCLRRAPSRFVLARQAIFVVFLPPAECFGLDSVLGSEGRCACSWSSSFLGCNGRPGGYASGPQLHAQPRCARSHAALQRQRTALPSPLGACASPIAPRSLLNAASKILTLTHPSPCRRPRWAPADSRTARLAGCSRRSSPWQPQARQHRLRRRRQRRTCAISAARPTR